MSEQNAAPRFERKVAFKVRSETWKNGSHFDLAEDLRSKLNQARKGRPPQ